MVMSLGERIFKLRTQKGMSQVDLADALEVSRQSISKWETNGSTPELDKLVKLSEIFEVSLDELILDKKPVEQTVPSEPKVIYIEKAESTAAKKTAGVVLLCFAALLCLMITLFGDILAGLVLAAPFVACGLVCLFVGKHAGLWCVWVVYLFIEVYLRFATGINWQFVLSSRFYAGIWTLQLIVAWIMLIIFLVLTIITAIFSRKSQPGTLRGNTIGTASSWAVYLLSWFIFALPAYKAANAVALSQGYRYVSAVYGWVQNIVLAVALVFTVRLICSLFAHRKSK